jgi:hypothetical protein
MEYRHCVNCSDFQSTSKLQTNCIGFCKRTGIEVRDTLSGCERTKKVMVLINNKPAPEERGHRRQRAGQPAQWPENNVNINPITVKGGE